MPTDPNAKLNYVEVRFNTRDGNKDSNTKVGASIRTKNNHIVADRTGWDNEEFDEGEWTAWTNLTLHGSEWKRSDLQGGNMTLAIDPDGNDDWDARVVFRFNWSDGTVDESGNYDFDMSHNHTDASAPLLPPYN
jgi:hypothetical protein